MRSLTAVFDDDLAGLLASLGELQAVEAGERRCKFSGDVITVNNLHAIFPESGSIKCVCDKPACVVALAGRVRTDEALSA
jgi:hypothetical protein